MKIFPKKYKNHLALQKALENTGWLFADRLLRMGVGLLISVWVARYLGPLQFGILNFASAFVALFGAVASLGLNGIVVRDLINEPHNATITLGTTFVLQLIGGLSAFGLVVLAIDWVRPNDGLIKSMVVVLGFATVFKASETVKYWFESQVQSKYVVWIENGAFLIFSVIKALLVVKKASLLSFVWTVCAEAILVSVSLMSVYVWQRGSLSSWNIQKHRAVSLIKESWPLALSSMAIMMYMRVDQIMLGQILGDDAVGVFSAAVRISEIWYFVPTAVVASIFPSIIEAKKKSEALYYSRLQKLYDLLVLFALLVAITVTFLSEWLISTLYGHAYQQAGVLLAVHVWAGIFVALNVASGRWFIDQGYSLLALKRNLIGLTVNVSLNIYLIPTYGALGAANSTLLSFIFSAYISDIFSAKTRIAFRQKTRALFFYGAYKRWCLDGCFK